MSFKSIIKNARKTRKVRLIAVIAVIAIVAPLVVNTILTRPKEAKAVWYNDSWKYRKKLIVNNAKVIGSTDLTNFPILVKLADADLINQAQTDGDDILFTDVNANKLDHEIENYNSSTGELYAWVEIPTLYATQDTPIYMYYGNVSSSSQQNASGTWNSNYVAVYHLQETVTDETSAGTHYDSTSPQENGTQHNNDDSTGKIYKSQYFDGDSDRIIFTDDADFDMPESTDFTLEVWMNVDTVATENESIGKKNSNGATSGDPGYGFYVDNSTGYPRIEIQDNDTAGTEEVLRITSSSAVAIDNWYHLTAVFDDNSMTATEIYVNGTDTNASKSCFTSLSTSETCDDTWLATLGSLENALVFMIGAQPDADSPTTGDIDEVRIAKAAFSSDWIATDYNTQYDPASFLSKKTQETQASANLFLKFDEGTGSTAQDQSEFNNNGTINGATWQNEEMCVSGKCLKFDGIDDVVTVTNSPSIDFNEGLDTGFTIESWVRVNSDGELSTGEILDKGTSTYIRTTNEGTDGLADLEVSLNLSSTAATKSIVNGITLNKWHHIAVGYTDDSDDEMSIYIDGNLAGTSADGDGPPATGDTNNVLIGGSSTTNFHGFIDEFKIYETERTASQIKSDILKISVMDGSSAAFGPDISYLSTGLVGYWKMDETATPSLDSSGNGNSGTWQLSPTSTGGKFGNAISLNGSTQYISGSTSPSLTQTGDITISAWVYRDTASQIDAIIDYSLTGESEEVNHLYHFTIDASNYLTLEWEHGLGTNDVITSSAAVSPTSGSWVFYTATRNTTTHEVNFYQNGIQLGSTQTYTYNPTGGTSSVLAIGRDDAGTSDYFDGTIDELRLYRRVLSPGEIQNLYNWAPGPITYYPLDENTGQSANDVSGNGNTVTLGATSSSNTDDPAWVTGKFGSALQFDGSNDYAQAGSNPITGTSAFTLEGWLKVGSHSNYGLATSIGNGTTSQSAYIGWVLTAQSGTSNSIGGGFYGTNYGSGITDNNWHYVTLTFAGGTNGTAILYVDGIAKVNTTYTPALASTAIYMGKANTGTSYWYNGLTDDVKIYNYARTSAQIIEDMNAGHPAPESPVGSSYVYYNFDEGYGSSANNLGNGGSSLNGTITSGAWTNSGKLGKALILTASSSITTTIVDPGSTNSVSLWVYPTTSAASKTLVTAGNLTTDSSSRPVYGGCTGTALSLSTWTHILVVSNGSTSCAIYQDGRLTSSGVTGVTFGNSINIGTSSFTGSIDEFKLYTSALTANQAKIEFNQGQIAVMGSFSTDSSGNPSWSDTDSYCPPGQNSACTGPVAHWKLDEGSWNATSGEVKDLSGNAINGTATSATTTSPGKLGNAGWFLFGKNVTLGSIGPGSPIDMTTNSFSIGGWIKISNGSSTDDFESIALHGATSPSGDPGYWLFFSETNNYIRLSISDGTRFNCPGSVSSTQTTVVDDNNWHYIEAVVDRTNNRAYIYIDGRVEQNCDISSLTGSLTTTETGYIGAYSGSTANDGYFLADNIIIYNYARSAAQVVWDYNLGAPIAQYDFDECSGITLHDTAPKADKSIAGYNGTITASTGNNVGTCRGTAGDMWADGATGKYSSSLAFDGTNDYVSGSITTDLDSIPLTVSAWVKFTDFNSGHENPRVIEIRDGTYSVQIIRDSSTGKWVTKHSLWQTSLAGTSWSTPSTGQWYHVVSIWDPISSTTNFYVNGASQNGTGINNIAAGNQNNQFFIGARSDLVATSFLKGQVDDVHIYNYALTAEQVKLLYNENSALRFQ